MNAALTNFRMQMGISVLAVLLFGLKLLAWVYTGSVAVLTDALESIVNMVAGFVGLYSLYLVAQPRDHNHPYGHGKAEFVSAAVEGGLIMAAGALVIYQTVYHLLHPKALQALDKGLWLVGATAVANGMAGVAAMQMGRRHKSLALQASGKHLLTDTWSTLAVVLGLLAMQFTGWRWIDPVLAFVLAIFILYSGYTIIRRSMAGIMDEADMDLLGKMIDHLNKERRPNWIDLHNLRVIQYGARLHVDAHLTLPYYLNLHEAHAEVDALNASATAAFGENLEMFVHTDGCLPTSCPICFKMDCPVRKSPPEQRLEWTLENTLANEKHRVR